MKKVSNSVRRIIVTTLFLTGIIVMQFQTGLVAFAAAKTWDGGGGDNLFSTAANWSGDTIPTNGDSILFDITGLATTEVLTNDIVGLSLTGISMYGDDPEFDAYELTGNGITISGTIESTATSGSGIRAIPLDLDITLAGDSTFSTFYVQPGNTIDTQGYDLSFVTDDECSYTGSPIVGSGDISINNTGGIYGSIGFTDNPAFTGEISIGSAYMIGSPGMLGSSSAGTTISGSGSISIYSEEDFTSAEPLTLGGTGSLGIQWSSSIGCSGDSTDLPQYQDTWTGPITLTSDFVYSGQDHDLTVTGPYTSNGFNFTASDPVSGSLTLPSEDTVAGAPQNLVATPASGQVALDWDAPASDGGAAITDYQVQYKLSSSGSWTTFADGTSTTSATTVTGLVNGSDYDFRVAAINAEGTGPYVTITNIGVSAAPTTADPITDLTVMTDATSHNIVLSWTAPASNGGSPITDYLVEARLNGSSTWSTVSHTPFSGNSFEILSGLTDGASYDFRISPINAQGTGPGTEYTNFAYSTGTGSTGNIENATGVGAGQTVTAPNTGFLSKIQIKSPFAIIILGFASVGALLFVAWPRRTN